MKKIIVKCFEVHDCNDTLVSRFENRADAVKVFEEYHGRKPVKPRKVSDDEEDEADYGDGDVFIEATYEFLICENLEDFEKYMHEQEKLHAFAALTQEQQELLGLKAPPGVHKHGQRIPSKPKKKPKKVKGRSKFDDDDDEI